MSLFSNIFSFAKPVIGFLTGNTLGSQITRTVLTGLALRKLSQSDQRENNFESSIQEEEPDFGVRLQASADPSTKIPVVYGTAFTGGKIVDVRMADNNQTMWYCLALCEVTGVKLSDSAQSVITFKDIYYNNSRIVFKSDGHTIDNIVDVNGKVDESLKGLVEIYAFKDGSTNPTNVEDFATQTANAYDLFPNWTSNHRMHKLAFILVKLKYNKEKNNSGLGNIVCKLENSMTLPGDCLNDLMTSDRYGANIATADIKQS